MHGLLPIGSVISYEADGQWGVLRGHLLAVRLPVLRRPANELQGPGESGDARNVGHQQQPDRSWTEELSNTRRFVRAPVPLLPVSGQRRKPSGRAGQALPGV